MVDTNVPHPVADHRTADAPGHEYGGEVGSIPVSGHHGVKYESSDADTKTVFIVGLVLAAVVLGGALLLIPFYFAVFGMETAKLNDLPVAAEDRATDPTRVPPQPRLEAIETLREPGDNHYQLHPPLAAEYLAPQQELLRDGNKNHEPIAAAIDALAGKLTAEGHAAPPNFLRRLPSKAGAGRVETGGQ